MYLVAIAWMYVVMMMAVVEALSPQGTVLGAIFTFLLYGLLPVGIVMYVLGTPMRLRARMAEQHRTGTPTSEPAPDGGGHTAGSAVAPERKEP